MRTHVYACETCGSMRLQWESWVDANRDKPVDESGDQKWCPRCEDHDKSILFLDRNDDGTWSETSYGRPQASFPSLRAAIRACRAQGTNRRAFLRSEVQS